MTVYGLCSIEQLHLACSWASCLKVVLHIPSQALGTSAAVTLACWAFCDLLLQY